MYNFHCSLVPRPHIKSKRLRWARHVARMEEGRNAYKILTGNLIVCTVHLI